MGHLEEITNMADVQKIDPVMEKPWQRAKRMEKYDFYNKSAYPPMNIEPVPRERSRLSGEGMTAEQRLLRKQWVQDQVLHNEPRYVPEVKPLNIFRRIYRWPADTFIEKPARMVFSPSVANIIRYCVPKILMTFGASYFVWYHIKYHKNDWTRTGGIQVFTSKPQYLGKGEPVPEKQADDFFERGFKSRTALR